MILHVEHIGHQMLSADVLQLLNLIVVGKEGAESLERLVIPVLRPEAALPVVSCQLVQLDEKCAIDAELLDLLHIVNLVFYRFCGPVRPRVPSFLSPRRRSRLPSAARGAGALPLPGRFPNQPVRWLMTVRLSLPKNVGNECICRYVRQAGRGQTKNANLRASKARRQRHCDRSVGEKLSAGREFSYARFGITVVISRQTSK